MNSETSKLVVITCRPLWRTTALTLLIFLGGAACGWAVSGHLTHRSIHHAFAHPEAMPAHIAARLAGVFGLTDAQTQQVRQIIERRQDALADIRRDIQPRVEVELSILESEIDAVLDERQRPKWRDHVKQVRALWLPPIPTTAPSN